MTLLNRLMNLLARIPRTSLLKAGRVLGELWFDHIPVRRRWTLAHLSAALPDLNPDAIEALGREVFVEQARNVLELLAYRRLLEADTTLPWITVDGDEHLELAKSEGQGLIILTAHIGNYDLLAAHQALSGEPLHIVSKELSNRALNGVWMQIRAELGIRVIPLKSIVASALAVLRNGEVVALVMDQHSTEPRAHESSFLGLPARTTQAVALLAVRSRAPILPCFIRREASGNHRIEFLQPFHPPSDGELSERLACTTERCLKIVEDAILKQPNQWLWLHRRWKDRTGTPLITPGARY